MSDNNLVPVENRAGQQALRQRQQREAAIAEGNRNRALATAEGGGVPDVLRPAAFVLPPRAELQPRTSRFAFLLKLTFALFVALPTILAALFYAFVASEQFATESRFAVRGSSSGASSMDLGGLFSLGTGGVASEAADSYILRDYIHSREMVETLVAEARFVGFYGRESADAYYRLDPAGTIEDFVDYWRMMSAVEFDTETGIMNLVVRAFQAEDAEIITAKVIEKSEELINQLSLRAREDSLEAARREVAIAEERYSAARRALATYRGEEREIDPAAVASAQQTLVSELERELSRRESQLTALLSTMSETSPRIVYLRNQMEALRTQVETERVRMAESDGGSTQGVLTERLSRFEELMAEREFAERAYVTALSALEAARVESLKQQRYLAVFVRGRAPQDALYPEGVRWTLIFFGGLFLTWGILSLIAAAIRDRFV